MDNKNNRTTFQPRTPAEPEHVGAIRGESESEQTPAGHELYVPLDETTIAIGRAGAAGARAEFLRALADKS